MQYFSYFTLLRLSFCNRSVFCIINNLSQKEKRVALTTKNKRLASGPVVFRQLSYIYFFNRDSIRHHQLPKRRLFRHFPRPFGRSTSSTATLTLAKNHQKMRSFRCEAFLRMRNRPHRGSFRQGKRPKLYLSYYERRLTPHKSVYHRKNS